MSEQHTHNRPAPATVEQRAALERADAASRTDRAVSVLGYWSPEIAGATTVAVAGTAAVHPAAAVLAYTALGARMVWALPVVQRLRRRVTGHKANTKPTATTDTATADHDSAEGVA